MTCRFIEDRRPQWPVRLPCETLGGSPAGYYAWRGQPSGSQRQRRDTPLVGIRAIHAEVKACYGSPRMHAEPVARGQPCCVNTVAKLMQENGIAARSCGQYLGNLVNLRASRTQLFRPRRAGSCGTALRFRMNTGSGSRTCFRASRATPASPPTTTACLSMRSCGSPRPAPPGAICRSALATGITSGSVSAAGPRKGSGNAFSRPCKTPTWSG